MSRNEHAEKQKKYKTAPDFIKLHKNIFVLEE